MTLSPTMPVIPAANHSHNTVYSNLLTSLENVQDEVVGTLGGVEEEELSKIKKLLVVKKNLFIKNGCTLDSINELLGTAWPSHSSYQGWTWSEAEILKLLKDYQINDPEDFYKRHKNQVHIHLLDITIAEIDKTIDSVNRLNSTAFLHEEKSKIKGIATFFSSNEDKEGRIMQLSKLLKNETEELRIKELLESLNNKELKIGELASLLEMEEEYVLENYFDLKKFHLELNKGYSSEG